MYNLPASTIAKRVIPKKTLVDQLGANTRMKDLFTDDVVKVIACAEKLFAQLSTSEVKYDKIDSYDHLMSLVK